MTRMGAVKGSGGSGEWVTGNSGCEARYGIISSSSKSTESLRQGYSK